MEFKTKTMREEIADRSQESVECRDANEIYFKSKRTVADGRRLLQALDEIYESKEVEYAQRIPHDEQESDRDEDPWEAA